MSRLTKFMLSNTQGKSHTKTWLGVTKQQTVRCNSGLLSQSRAFSPVEREMA